MSDAVEINWSKVKNIFEGATRRMQENPDRPAIGAPKATVRVIRERLFEATAEGHTFQIDEPVARGGSGLAPSPMAYFSASAAACLASHITQSAAFMDVPFTALEVEATVLWDNRRKFNIANLEQAALGLIFHIDLRSDAPKNKSIEMLKHAEAGCYASDVVRNKTPLRAHLIVNGEEAYVHKSGAEIPDLPAGPAFGDNPTGMSAADIAAKQGYGPGAKDNA